MMRSGAFRGSGWLGGTVLIIGGWSLVAALFAAHGQAITALRGASQPWWPSFGYALAVFSVWAALTPASFVFFRKLSRIRRRALAAGALAAGFAATNLLHAALFVLVYGSIFNNAGALTRWGVAERMLTSNFHTNLVFYAALGVIAALMNFRRAAASSVTAEAVSGTLPAAMLRSAVRGEIRLFPHDEIDRIAAAGNYAEIWSGGRPVLVDETLGALLDRLPPQDFMRIHRSHAIRIDKVRAVRGLGRGDALVTLSDGAELRLSRRYRRHAGALLDGALPD